MSDPEEFPHQKIEEKEAGKGFDNVSQESIPSEHHLDRNEDSILVNKEKGVFGIFDGVSSGGGGEIASRIASEAAAEYMDKFPAIMSEEEAKQAIREALAHAQKKILEYKEKNEKYSTIATTASIVKIYRNAMGERGVAISNVGDSRVYVIRKRGQLNQVTLDDNFGLQIVYAAKGEEAARNLQRKFSEMLDRSSLTEEEQAMYSQRNRITNALGLKDINQRIESVFLNEGDIILLNSDGVSGNLTDTEIERNVRESVTKKEDIAQQLVAKAKARSQETITDANGKERKHTRAKFDDMSAIAIEIRADEVHDPLNDFSKDMEWSELFAELQKTKGVMGTSEFHPLDQIMSFIRDARMAARKIPDFSREAVSPFLLKIPRTGGLREKVADLIQSEELRDRPNRNQ